jgi:hypothetical protein
MTLIPRDPSIKPGNIGKPISLSPNDIKSLNKAYSCQGKVATDGGGHYQVRYLDIHKENLQQ